MNGLIPFQRTVEQTTETMPPSPKTITVATTMTNNDYKLTRAATLLRLLCKVLLIKNCIMEINGCWMVGTSSNFHLGSAIS